MSSLSDLLKSQPISARRAAEIAAEKGIDLPYGTIAGYWSGRHARRPLADTLEKLAQVLPQISLRQLQEAAWGTHAPFGDAPRDGVYDMRTSTLHEWIGTLDKWTVRITAYELKATDTPGTKATDPRDECPQTG